jgi:hypothetical protein
LLSENNQQKDDFHTIAFFKFCKRFSVEVPLPKSSPSRNGIKSKLEKKKVILGKNKNFYGKSSVFISSTCSFLEKIPWLSTIRANRRKTTINSSWVTNN